MNGIVEQMDCEQATGCRQYGKLGKLYGQGGVELDLEQAQDALLNGREIEVPNAGAGSYRAAFAALGFEKVKVFDWTSSAGDWSFAVFDGCQWLPAFQRNRYPYHGFAYSVDHEWSFNTCELCFAFMAS